jgi:hypothetical protein
MPKRETLPKPSSNMTPGEGKPMEKPAVSIFVARGKEHDIISEVGLVGDTQRGSTAHFNVFYDSTLGTDGITISDAILQVCEADFVTLQGYFGGLTPGGLPFNIHVTTGSSGASHATCAATTLSVGALTDRSAAGVNMAYIAFMRSLVIAEEDEVFEDNLVNWNCGASNGEGLSRVLANAMYPGAEPPNFVSAPVWLDTPNIFTSQIRPDFVNVIDPTDVNYVSIGCSVLFLNWLHYQLDFSWKQIVLAGDVNLAQTYTNLTGRTDGFAQFKALLQTNFPVGSPSGVTSDNVFPLFERQSLGGSLSTSPSALSDGGVLHIFGIGVSPPNGIPNTLLHWWYDRKWNGPEDFDDGKWQSLSPSAITRGPGLLEVFGVGQSNELLHRSWDGKWNGPQSLGGSLSTSPSVITRGAGSNTPDVYGVGQSKELLHWSYG